MKLRTFRMFVVAFFGVLSTWASLLFYDKAKELEKMPRINPVDPLGMNYQSAAMPTFKVTYLGNGYTGGSVPIDQNDYTNKQPITVLGNVGSLEKIGFIFAGWTNAAGAGATYLPGATFAMGSANVTLLAKWIVPPAYKVSYLGNGNTGGSVPIDQNNYTNKQPITVLGNAGGLQKDGFIFAGWTNAAGSGALYLPGATFAMGSANVILLAKWSTSLTNPMTPDIHWEFNETGGATAYDSSGSFDATLHDGASLVAGVLVLANGTNARAHAPSASLQYRGGNLNISFWIRQNTADNSSGGWVFSKPWNGNGEYNYRLRLGGTGGFTFSLSGSSSWAWSPSQCVIHSDEWVHIAVTINSEKLVRMYTNGILAASTTHTVTSWIPTIPPTVAGLCIGSVYPYSSGWGGNASYTFDGYLDDIRIYTNRVLEPADVLRIYNYGAPKPPPTEVTYSGNGSTGGSVPVDANYYTNNQTVTVLGNTGSLIKTGHTFAGWTNAAGTLYQAGSTFVMGGANVTLFAKWTALPTYTVSYNHNGSTGGSVPVDANNYTNRQTVTVLGNTGSLVKTWHTFAGWTNAAGTLYQAGSTFVMESANVTLSAKWTAMSDPFVLGETEPTPANCGAGNMLGHPPVSEFQVINGNVTVAAGTTLENKIVNGKVIINWGPGTVVRNVEVRGPAVAPTSYVGALIEIRNLPARMSPETPQVLVEFVTIRPQTPSPYWDGIGRKGFKTVRCLIEDVTDGWGIFSTVTNGTGYVCVSDEGSCLTRLAQFRPDYAYSSTSPRPETHNDGIQNQGSLDDPDFTGTSINARHSETKSSPLPPTRTQIAAVMLNCNTQSRAGIKLDRVWIRGGVYSINAGLPVGYVEIINSRFERPGTAADGRAPTKAISIKSTVTRKVSGNTYLDNGAPVPVSGG